MEDIFANIQQAIMDGDLEATKIEVEKLIGEKIPAERILKDGMIPAMGRVGQLFEEGEYFVPEMLISARAMQGGLTLLKPQLAEGDVKPIGKIVVGTVKGDLHDIGKNLVGMMLEGAGFEVIDLGSDVDAEKFVEAVRANQAHVVGMSALLTTTMTNMPVVIESLKNAGLRDSVKVLIGGAPVTQAYADQIGADGYAPDASQAAKLALSFVS
ncbi:MAG: cobalamin-binding protein [Chloroflexi bacterium]|nr:cobalamin-binding protein [Chloroflexota bacterium]